MTEQQIIETLATEVMGWVPIPPRPNGPPEVFPAFCFPIYGDIKDSCIVAHKDADGVIDTAHWNPLQNIADAFQVMDKLCIALIPQAGNPPEDMKYLAVFDDSPIGPKIEVFAKTAQEAICKAAIEWVSLPDEEII